MKYLYDLKRRKPSGGPAGGLREVEEKDTTHLKVGVGPPPLKGST